MRVIAFVFAAFLQHGAVTAGYVLEQHMCMSYSMLCANLSLQGFIFYLSNADIVSTLVVLRFGLSHTMPCIVTCSNRYIHRMHMLGLDVGVAR